MRDQLAHAGLVRPCHGRWIAGVCAGLARKTGVPAWLVRVAFVLGNFLPGPGLLVYLALWAAMPSGD
jgi:phage shock protein PspC (stress-responsive transcriptional regulator)